MELEESTHLVRWRTYISAVPWQTTWTKWHITQDAVRTLCGRNIPVGINSSFLPDTDDDLSKCNCTICKLALKKRDKDG